MAQCTKALERKPAILTSTPGSHEVEEVNKPPQAHLHLPRTQRQGLTAGPADQNGELQVQWESLTEEAREEEEQQEEDAQHWPLASTQHIQVRTATQGTAQSDQHTQ